MTNRTCSVDGCNSKAAARGWCSSHYNRWYATGSTSLEEHDGLCAFCGDQVPDKGSTGPRSKYCSKACRGKAAYQRNRDKINAKKRSESAAKRASVMKRCKQCKVEFSPEKSLAQEFCSRYCNQEFHRDNRAVTCAEDGCDRPLRARGMCFMHYRRWARAAGIEEAQAWDARRRKNYHKRLERLNHPGADVIDPQVVAERDGWVCGICEVDVDKTLQYPDPMSRTTDHIVPLAKGGLHVYSNVQLAHLFCNMSKGDSLEADAMSA